MFLSHRTLFPRAGTKPQPFGTMYPFDAVYVINLDRRKDRWTYIHQHLQSLHLWHPTASRRFPAIDGSTLDVKKLYEQDKLLSPDGYARFLEPTERKLFGMDLTAGSLGCALSHRAVWSMIVKEQHRCALIVEDDAEFSPKLPMVFKNRWQHVPSDWELVYLGGLDLLSSGKPPRPYLAPGLRRAYSGQRELTAYVLHAKSALRCLELTNTLTWQIDTHICCNCNWEDAAQDHYIIDPMSYVLQPSLVIQLAKFGTDVQVRGEPNPPLTDAARRMREFVGGKTSVR